MSTATRKQLESKIETLGSVINKLISEMNNLKDLAIGTMTLVKDLPGYDDALQKMKNDLKETEKEED
jgi:hypothetical protein